MANIVIWVAILLTVSCVSQAVNISAITRVECTSTGSVVTLDLTDVISLRPTMAIINGAINDDSCKVAIDTTIDVQFIPVNFSTCNIKPTSAGTNVSQPQTEFKLFIVHTPEFISEGDLLVPIVCSDINVGTVDLSGDVEQRVDDRKTGENEISLNPTNINMTFEDTAGKTVKSIVALGDKITLKLTAPADTSFEVKNCTVESEDENRNRIGPYKITTGWCTDDESLLSNFINSKGLDTPSNIQKKKSAATVKAFRLVGQGIFRSIKFNCTLRWCEHENGACSQPIGDGCTANSTSRRRRQAGDVFDRYRNDKTVASSLRVDLPGFERPVPATATVATIDYVVKMAVLLCCALRYLL